MTPFAAYEMFTALKLHFTSNTYDFNKFNGKCNVSNSSFMKRKDRAFYFKLSKHKNPKELVIANMAHRDNRPVKKFWVGTLFQNPNSEQIYLEWKKRQESLTYHMTEQLSKQIGDGGFKEYLMVVDGTHPPALQDLVADEVSYETLIMLNSYFNFLPHWNKNIKDTFIWPDFKIILYKYKSFVNFDKDKVARAIQRLV